MNKQQFGVISVGVMGKNLAINVESRGILFRFMIEVKLPQISY